MAKEKLEIGIEKATEDIKELDTLKKIRENLREEIGRLQITASNLEAQKHSSQIQKEQSDKLSDADTFNKFAAEERKIEVKRIEAEKRIDTAEQIERKINDREREVDRRELKTMELEERIADLNRQRSNFETYKTAIEKELETAKITTAEANATFEKINSEKQSLVAREKAVKNQEAWWNDRVGELETRIKAFRIEKEQFEGLKKAQITGKKAKE